MALARRLRGPCNTKKAPGSTPEAFRWTYVLLRPARTHPKLQTVKEAIDSGRPIIIYPEGTRVKPGETPPLQSGFAGLYRALGLPVVPVAVDSGRLWGPNLPRGKGAVHFLIGESIPPGLKREEVEARVHAAINALESTPKSSA